MQVPEIVEWDDFGTRRKKIFDGVKDAFQKKFPHSYNGVRVDVKDLRYADPEEFGLKDQKEALMTDKFLARRLRGRVQLFDDTTGAMLEEKDMTLMRVPYMTDRGTFLHNGTEYSLLNQARLLPGAYTRRKSNGELETHFNVRRGTGRAFRVRLEPATGLFKLDVGQSSLRLYSLLKDIGVSDEELEKRWGPELLEVNRKAYDSRVFEKAYQRFAKRPEAGLSRDEKVKAIQEALNNTMLETEVVKRTLPNIFDKKAFTRPPLEMEEPAEQSEFKKPDYQMLARILNDKFKAGIDLGLPQAQLVQEILEEMAELAPGVDRELLTSALEIQTRALDLNDEE